MMAAKIAESLSIEGRSFSQAQLKEYSLTICRDAGEAPWKKEVFAFVHWFLDSGEEDLIQETSGTTARPKKIKLSKNAMLVSAGRTLDHLDLHAGDSALLTLPVRYIAGKMMVVRALAGGLDLLMKDPSGRPLKGLEKPVGLAAMVPLQVYESLQYGDPMNLVSKLLVGGGDLHSSLEKELAGKNAPVSYLSFGMTETCTHFALKRINGPGPQSSYHSLDGVELKLDKRGCLLVRVEGITPEPVITNDLVTLDPGHRSFSWLGRFDHVINSGGIKIVPEQVEQKASLCTGRECLVLSEPDEKLGEKVVLLVEFQGEKAPLDIWYSCLRQKLPVYEVPKRIITLPELPRNNSFKPDRTSAARCLL